MRVSAAPNSSTSSSISPGRSAVSVSWEISAARSRAGTRWRNASSSAAPERPGSSPGTISTQRHSSGIGWRASSGAGGAACWRRPPSTTSPPSANVHRPTAERAPRPAARASSPDRAPGRASPSARVPRRARASCRSRARRARGSPRARAGARRRGVPAPPGRAARTRARDRRSAPPRRARRRRGLEHDRGPIDRDAEPAEPAVAVARDVEHPQVQPRGRLDPDACVLRGAHRRLTAAPTCSRTKAIASCSRGPAVLSTTTCRRPSSRAISSGASGGCARRGWTPRGPRGWRG